jgi:TPP-dependent 2-oxoacid decarboxylase
MMRFGAAPVIFLVNNRGYAIEILIHDGLYNRIQNWDYTGDHLWSYETCMSSALLGNGWQHF